MNIVKHLKGYEMQPKNLKLFVFNLGLYSLLFLACSISGTSVQTEKLESSTQETPVQNPSPFPSPTDTPTSIPMDIFSLEDVNTIPPEDIIFEVNYAEAGGGGGRQFECIGIPPGYPVASDNNSTIVEDKAALLLPLDLIVCGWEQDEHIEVNVTNPAGDTATTHLVSQLGGSYIPEEQSFQGIYYSEYIYYPPIDSMEGKYIFIFTGEKGETVKYTIEYIDSDSPIAYIIYYKESDVDNNTNIDMSTLMDKFPFIVLSGYLPNERVRLFLYNTLGHFQAWQEHKVNQYGRLNIQLMGIKGQYIAVGDVSNVEIHLPVYPDSFIFFDDRLDPIYLTCKDTIPTRLRIGDYAYVSTRTSTSNRLRSEATVNSEMLDKLSPGTIMEVIDGPKCADGILWWKVRGVSRSFEGWTGEGDTEYWLEPCYSKECN